MTISGAMTISGDWVHVMKSEAPSAFTRAPPFTPRCVFIDGMPSLMIAGSMRRWDDFIRFNFACKIQKFVNQGVKAVVLGFDDYAHVPMAKAITQENRSKNTVTHDVDERHTLSTQIPDDYPSLIRNRIFKRKVIELIICEIANHVRPASGREDLHLIIDYVECPLLFQRVDGKWSHSTMDEVPPMGECDTKWTRWCRMYGDCCAVSVDGDFLPIALIEHERQLRELGPGGGSPNKISIYRMEYNMKDGDGEGAGTKRAAGGQPKKVKKEGDGTGEAEPRAKRRYEFVNIGLLYHVLSSAMRQCAPSTVSAGAGQEMQWMGILAFLIGITGTDFSRKLPLLGAKKIWDCVPMKQIWPTLLRCYDPVANQVNVSDACDLFIARLYLEKFRKHARGEDLEGVVASIQKSKLSDKTKGQLSSVLPIDCTVRNCNWVLHYWQCRQPVRASDGSWDFGAVHPDPVQDEYGFRWVEKKGGKRSVQWLDVV